MNQHVKKMWVDALRSGEYKQNCNGVLHDEGTDTFCCLGVLCDVYRKETKSNMPVKKLNSQFGEVPNHVVARWAGFDATGLDPMVTIEIHNTKKHRHITDVNDNMGFTFNQIADIIDSQL